MKSSNMVSNWKYFEIGELFPQIYKASAYNAQDLISSSAVKCDAIRYITRTDTNNGCKEFVQNGNFTQIEEGNAITIGDTTSTIYYQNEQFICGDHIVVLRAPFLNEIRGIFIVALLNKERFRYNYGRSFKMDIIKKTRILLPSIDNDVPDWDIVESIMRQKVIPALPPKSKCIWDGKYDNNPISSASITLDSVKWDWFTVSDLFYTFERGKVHSQYSLPSGNEYFYVGAKKDSNGVMTRCGYDENLVSKGNCVIFICNGEGSVGYSNYMDRDFMASGDLILGYGEHINQYTGLFLSTILDKERPKYSFGRKYGKYVKGTKILLPTTKDGTPDWEFMENYIKSLPYSANI